MFVKPVFYVVELIFGCVVTFGTADKMILLLPGKGGVRCLLSKQASPYLGPCIAPIIFGSLALLLLLFTLWRRLIAAFDSPSKEYAHTTATHNTHNTNPNTNNVGINMGMGMGDVKTFTNGAEATLCLMVAFIWLVVASILSHYTEVDTKDKLIGEKIVHIVFAWLLLVFCMISAAVAWLVPEHDGNNLYNYNYNNYNAHTTTHSNINTTPPDPYAPVVVQASTDSVTQPPPLASIDEENEGTGPHERTTTTARGLDGTGIPKMPAASAESLLGIPIQAIQSDGLNRQNAARPLSTASVPDTKGINNKLNEWDRVIEGPPQNDAHADALESASRIPVSITPQFSGSARAAPILRRRTAAANNNNTNSNDEDEILPDFSKIQ